MQCLSLPRIQPENASAQMRPRKCLCPNPMKYLGGKRQYAHQAPPRHTRNAKRARSQRSKSGGRPVTALKLIDRFTRFPFPAIIILSSSYTSHLCMHLKSSPRSTYAYEGNQSPKIRIRPYTSPMPPPPISRRGRNRVHRRSTHDLDGRRTPQSSRAERGNGPLRGDRRPRRGNGNLECLR